ncbi:etoposide-induced protein 2.4 homolog [Eurytemora carolleeae]|uniref:etoposide-induced protein 2.4 homolog n=1 Tax=Eurytemora carolleeae TaxID=1294199 RepID=UPI000C76046F|nr:etoposide-induced protein 2.4 homolog [Eurytemora carolleeae]|eukprot:XP_023337259.1 etoposide-induced protein 2.4 homolog [Eurytemora affinis]
MSVVSNYPKSFSTFEILRNGMWAFTKGFADSLRGAVDLFLLDYRRVQEKEQKLQQREIDRELLLNRDSPARDIVNIAKKRAMERRERDKQRELIKPKKKEPKILERTVKCCLLNGAVFWSSILIFENIILPAVEMLVYVLTAGSGDSLWLYTQPILSLLFSTLWVLPFFLLSKIVNAIWFQDIADLAFRSTQGRPLVNLSISVMIADTVISIVVESLFLIQGKVISMLPIEILGSAFNLLHLCLLHSLYSFEYKWFSQGLELHKRLDFVETNWPYFLGFGLPLAVITSLPTSQVAAGCVFSIIFPLFIVAGNQASIVPSPGVPRLNIFAPTILLSNSVFAHTLYRSSKAEKRPTPQR